MEELLCIENLEVNRKNSKYSFKNGEHYKASKINDNWWCIDSIGVEAEMVNKHFVNEKYVKGINKKTQEEENLEIVSGE